MSLFVLKKTDVEKENIIMTSIKIKEIAFYHPENRVDNSLYLEHFAKKSSDITGLLESLGKSERYIIDNDENSLTMGIQVAKDVLAKAEMKGSDIDMIMFSTQVPEYLLPTNAVFVHNAIEGHNRTILMDSNANCAGMTVAVDNVSRYMLSNKHVKNALVIGSDANSFISNPEQAISYANFSDGSAAVILTRVDEDSVGFVDSIFEVDTSNKDNVVYPPKGVSKSVSEPMDFKPFDITWFNEWTVMIEELLERNDMTIDDIDSYCFSQFGESTNQKIMRMFEIPQSKVIRVGHKYGYTSTSSPFVCLHEGIKDGRIKRGDTVLFWTIGCGHQMIAMIYKY